MLEIQVQLDLQDHRVFKAYREFKAMLALLDLQVQTEVQALVALQALRVQPLLLQALLDLMDLRDLQDLVCQDLVVGLLLNQAVSYISNMVAFQKLVLIHQEIY
jgi:hypothetical protein